MISVAYNIRLATLKDLDTLVVIENKCFVDGVAEIEQTHRERIEVFSQGYLVLEVEDRLVGYISSEIWSTQNLTDSFFALNHKIKRTHSIEGTILYVSSMGILPQYRNLGYGFKLFERLFNNIQSQFPSITTATLIVGESWIAARKLYTSQGFEQVRTIPNFFKGEMPDNGIIMYRNLIDSRDFCNPLD